MTVEESHKLIAEQRKLLADALKLAAEELRHREADKLRAERWLLPLAMAGAFFGSFVAVAMLLIHLAR